MNPIIVVGAGPAGIMAAIRAATLGDRVILIEKNRSLGRKLLLCGKGRCNLTNACDFDSFIQRFSKQGQFLRDAFNVFFNRDLMQFFQSRGLVLKVERQQRVFPITDASVSIVNVLKEELKKLKVEVRYGLTLKDVVVSDNKILGIRLDNGAALETDRLILACGGVSYQFTGSTGDWIPLLEKRGHTITDLRPGLIPLRTQEDPSKGLEGLTLKNIRLTFHANAKKIVSDIGELLFTGNGVSGPLVLSLSGVIVDWLRDGLAKTVRLTIDLKPALSLDELDQRLQKDIAKSARKTIKNTLRDMLPQKFIMFFLKTAGIDPEKKTNQLTYPQRARMIQMLKGFPLEIVGSLPIEEAMVTRGGVSLKEVNPRTMESRLIRGLFFCGEMLDIDADTGGFNLQAAFSTGYLAGQSAHSFTG